MSHLQFTTHTPRRKSSHLSYQDRQKLEGLIQANHKLPKFKKLRQYEMAATLQCSEASISRELNRGEIFLLQSDLAEYKSYSAVVAQDDYDYVATNKGPKLKIENDHEFADHISNKIIEQKWSPDAIIMDLEKQTTPQFKTTISTRTLYNYINAGLIYGIESKDLPREGKQERRSYKRVQRSNRSLDAPSITERPLESTNRTEPGHWEMDCIVSGKGKGTAALLTMNERLTRESRVFKIASQTQEEVISVLDKLERSLGRIKFNEMFKSITVDNGSEFLNWHGLQRSVRGTKKIRTNIYFCHPFSSWERGTNEQNNGLIRYHIPKGSAIKDYSKAQIKQLEEWLNNYPRRVLGGLTANEARERKYILA